MTTVPAGDDRHLVLLRPDPAPVERLFGPDVLKALQTRFRVVLIGPDDIAVDGSDDDIMDRRSTLDNLLPEAFAVIGQPDLPRERLLRGGKLRAVLNVEGNFLPNIDYWTCHERGIRVLGCGPAYAQAVAEYALGLALDLARGISRGDRAFRAGAERYLGSGTSDSILLRQSTIGLVGFGQLGRALLPLLIPFGATVRVYDPWLPAAVLQDADVIPATLEETLSQSRIVFVLAAATSENSQLLDGPHLDMLPDGARLVLVSRAGVTDYPALYERVASGRLLAGIDVWPAEPVPADDVARTLDGLVLSAHRAGGIPAAFSRIGEMVLDDLTLMAAGLPPVRMQIAAPELAGRYRNRPAGA